MRLIDELGNSNHGRPNDSRERRAIFSDGRIYLKGKVEQLNGQVKAYDGGMSSLETEVTQMKRYGKKRDKVLKEYLIKEAERRRASLEDAEHLLRICKLSPKEAEGLAIVSQGL
jgi:hypothetical protein